MNEYMRMADRMYDLDNQFEQLKKKNTDLEKENAELKAEVNILDNCNRLGDVITEAYKEQLTKAKELVKKMSYEYQRLCLIKKETLTDAEQFLKEIEE